MFSAPGKRNKDDDKVTDMLFNCHKLVAEGSHFDKVFNQIAERYTSIATAFAFEGMSDLLDEMHNGISQRETADWVASRGEWAMARMMAYILKATFNDTANLIKIKGGGEINPLTYRLIANSLDGSESRIDVYPGYYGSDKRAKIRVLPRGGSDYTAGIIAAAANADMYENWTDVKGVRGANPKVVNDPKLIPHNDIWRNACIK